MASASQNKASVASTAMINRVSKAAGTVPSPPADCGAPMACGSTIRSTPNPRTHDSRRKRTSASPPPVAPAVATHQSCRATNAALPGSFLSDVNYPLLETKDEWVIQGFSYANYLLELGEKAQSEVYTKSSLDLAMRDAFWKVRRFLMTTQNLSEDEAISLISVAVDFGVTQVANGNWGIHAVLKKCIFANG